MPVEAHTNQYSALMIDPYSGEVQCDKCMKAAPARSEKRAEADGWLVDYSVQPHRHICVACKPRS